MTVTFKVTVNSGLPIHDRLRAIQPHRPIHPHPATGGRLLRARVQAGGISQSKK